MKTQHRILGWAFCAALACTFVHAGDSLLSANAPVNTAMTGKLPKGNATKWLTVEEEQKLSDSVPPPPSDDKNDLTTLLERQQVRDDLMRKECLLDKSFSYFLFAPAYGSGLTPENDPKFFEMLADVTAATRVVNETAKNKYQRKRPYQGHPTEVKRLFDVAGFSYPSGHSMGSYTLATVLGAIFPDKKQAFLDRAAAIAQSRVDAGVHYPSDIAEGKFLGLATGDEIIATPTFKADLAAVQAELKK